MPTKSTEDELVVKEVAVTIPQGPSFTIATDAASDDPVTADYLRGVPYHPAFLDLMLQLVRPGQTVIDVGAHIGTFALTAAAAGCRAVAIEGSSRNCDLIRRSAALNGFSDMAIYNVIAGERPGIGRFCPHGPWGYVDLGNNGSSGTEMRAASVDEIMEELKLSPGDVALVKVDVEGSEVEVLRGMASLLCTPNAPPVLFESNGLGLERYRHRPYHLKQMLHGAGYSIYRIGDYTLSRFGVDDVEVESCIDYLAIKGTLPPLDRWAVIPPRTIDQTIEMALHYGRLDHETFRGWVATALQDAPAAIRSDSRIVDLLGELVNDPKPFVRERTRWWTPMRSTRAARQSAALKVFHLTTWNDKCGIADYAENSVRHLDERGVTNSVFPLSVKAMRWMPQSELAEVFSKFLEQCEGFDLVHIQHEFSFFRGPGQFLDSCRQFSRVLAGLKKKGIPVVVTFHSEPEFHPLNHTRNAWIKAKSRWLTWRYYLAPYFRGKNAFKAITHTRKSRFTMIAGGFDAQNVKVISMGHVKRELPALSQNPAEAKRRLGLPEDAILLSIFGFVSYYKGHVWATEALQKLPPKYYLAIIGGGHPDAEADYTIDGMLQTWQKQNPGRLIITGYANRETIDLYHAATDICLAPYIPCNLSSSAAVTWAISSGKPVIGSRIPAFREINEEAECMALVTPGAVHELRWQIQKVSSDSELREKLVRNARQFAARHCWSEVAAKLETMYRELVPAGARKTNG